MGGPAREGGLTWGSRPACCSAFLEPTMVYFRHSSYRRAFFLSTSLQHGPGLRVQSPGSGVPQLPPVRATGESLTNARFPLGKALLRYPKPYPCVGSNVPTRRLGVGHGLGLEPSDGRRLRASDSRVRTCRTALSYGFEPFIVGVNTLEGPSAPKLRICAAGMGGRRNCVHQSDRAPS